jgi:hypothetical protein
VDNVAIASKLNTRKKEKEMDVDMLVIVWAFSHSGGTGCVSGVEGLSVLHIRWTMLQ